MMNPDDLDPPRPVAKPADLQTLSIEDLTAYIASLRTEIARAETMIEKKQAIKSGADGLFRF